MAEWYKALMANLLKRCSWGRWHSLGPIGMTLDSRRQPKWLWMATSSISIPETTHLIMELTMPDEIWQLGKIKHEVSTDNFALYHGFLHWKESTSSHLSFWQASWSL
jgi:hypothetical protein